MAQRVQKASAGARLAVLAAAGVALPVGLLCFLQYRSLMELHSQTTVAVQENLRRSLQEVSQKAAAKVLRIAADSLSGLAIGDARRDRVAELDRKFAAIKRAHAEVDELWVVSQCDCQGGPFAIVWTGERARLVDCGGELRADYLGGQLLPAAAAEAVRGSDHPPAPSASLRPAGNRLGRRTRCPEC